MPIYRAPVDDYKFLLHELFELEKQTDLPRFAELSADTVDDVRKNAGKFCEEVLHPLNQSGDEEGCHFENGVVRTPKGFAEAYKAYCEAGWGGLSAPEDAGGSNLPALLTMAVAEMAMSANQAFAMYPGLTSAAYGALYGTGAPWMKQHIVPKMGRWAQRPARPPAASRKRWGSRATPRPCSISTTPSPGAWVPNRSRSSPARNAPPRPAWRACSA